MIIPIVNKNDEIIEYKERSMISPEDIIRTTSIWLTDTSREFVLLQKRSINKKNNPGLWCPSVSGTVEKDETYEQNAYKELEEEIGLSNIKLTPGKKYFYNTFKFNQIFFAKISLDTEFVLQVEEVSEVKWFKVSDLNFIYNKNPEDFVKFIGVALEDLYKN